MSFFLLFKAKHQPAKQPASQAAPASQPEQLEWYRSVPRRGASPVSSATPSTELRVIYLTWMVTFPAFSTSHGVKAKHFFFYLIFLSFSYLEHSIFQYLRTSRETARAVPLSIIATNIIIFPEILYPVVGYSVILNILAKHVRSYL